MDVAVWLQGLGLERYVPAFLENRIEADILPSLTVDDLKDLGVTLVGDRRRLLDAIAALGAAVPPAATPVAAPDPTAPAEAERRQLTVMFCDLVGSTALSTRFDPEDLRELIGAYHRAVADMVGRFDGFVAKYMGDGVLIYFGYPQAHEDDAERAVRAGLAVIEAVGQLPAREDLRVRLGIATGLAVVGDLIGTGASQERGVVGETPNLAARLQAMAEPNTVVLSEATRLQLGQMFELEDLGHRPLKGFDRPVKVWRARGGPGTSSRSEAVYARALMPIVGRGEDLDLLLRWWQRAKAGDGRVVLLSGEAGIGKSRLLAAMEERLVGEPHVSLRYFCSAHHEDTPLYPVISRLEQEAGFTRHDGIDDRLAKLEALLAPTALTPGDVALLAELMSIPKAERYPLPEMGPQQRKQRTFSALTQRLTSFALKGPVLVLFEDAHWADPTSLEMLDTVVERISNLPVLLVVSFRPDFVPAWFGGSRVSLMTLGRLDHRDAAAVAAHVVKDRTLSSALLDRIVMQSDGVPLFIEELTKAVLETPDRDAISKSLSVPNTLQASLMAKLDRLPTAKQVAQIGAVIGREFSHALLSAIARMPEHRVARGVEELVAAGLVFRRGTPLDRSYIFKHALIQDVAYESLLRSRRSQFHAALVSVLEQDVEAVTRQSARLGYHSAQAGLTIKAATYYRMAGELSEERAAFSETRSLLRRGLAFAEALPDSPDQRSLTAELLVALGRILQMTKGLMDPEAAAVSEQAVAIARTIDQAGPLTRVLMLRYFAHIIRCDFNAACSEASELKLIAERIGDTPARILAHLALGYVDFHRGRFESTRAEVGIARDLHSRTPNVRFSVPFEAATVQSAAVFSAFSSACMGYLDRASADIERHYERTHQLAPLARAFGLSHICRFDLVIRDDTAACCRHNKLLTSIADEHELSQFGLLARCNQAWLDVRTRSTRSGIHQLKTTIGEMRAVGYRLFRPYYLFLLADALAFADQSASARSALDEGLALAAQTDDAWLRAELYRRKWELLLGIPEPDPAEAEKQLRQAIDVSRSQSAKLFELRAAISLARLCTEQDRRLEARDLLMPVYGWFTEGFDTTDLKEAKALLDELT